MVFARLFSLAFVTIALLAVPAPAAAGGDVENGRRLAEKHCQRCHVVSRERRFAGIGSTPSFMLLAGLGDWRDRFLTFFERRPHPVFVRLPGVAPPTNDPPPIVPFEVTAEGVEDILAYAATLRTE